ncbi:MAG TPA: tryptophan--tRNA ligase [Cyclobacteriaceae bacterium]
MSRILTGIQSTGIPHLGNLLGAIIPAIELSRKENNDSFYFIADLHSLTTIKDPEVLRQNTYSTAAAWLAFGFDTDRNTFYRQSHVPQVCELTWYLNCFTPFPMLANAHSFKDKSERLADVNSGLFTYPVLMAADIILYDANFVPVGKDQQQHLEITRDIAGAFNHKYGDTFIIPEALIDEKVMVIPGTDGQKMSKSYNNTISIFQSDEALRKNIMSITTDSLPLEEPKNPDKCNVFALYKLLAEPNDVEIMRKLYLNGNYGYGQAKQELYDLLINKFEKERKAFNDLLTNPDEIEEQLHTGEVKAAGIADKVLNRVRKKLGYF